MNNTVQCPAEYSKVVTNCPDGLWIEGYVVIIIVNSIKIFQVVPLCKWAFNSLSLLIFISVYFHSQPLSIPHFIQTKKSNLLLVMPSCELNISCLSVQSLELDFWLTVTSLLQPVPCSIWKFEEGNIMIWRWRLSHWYNSTNNFSSILVEHVLI